MAQELAPFLLGSHPAVALQCPQDAAFTPATSSLGWSGVCSFTSQAWSRSASCRLPASPIKNLPSSVLTFSGLKVRTHVPTCTSVLASPPCLSRYLYLQGIFSFLQAWAGISVGLWQCPELPPCLPNSYPLDCQRPRVEAWGTACISGPVPTKP